LVERAYIIRKRRNSKRMRNKLYLFNSFGMLIPYCVVIALNFYFRFAIRNNDGTCRIGMKRIAMIPLIGFDILVNVYLTSLFLIPLRSLYSYKNNPNSQTRTVALRTFIGSCCTLISSVVNLTMVMALNGEPAWICLMCCNVDILFSVLVLHWISSKDNASTLSPTSSPTNLDLRFPSPPLTSSLKTKQRLIPRPPLANPSGFDDDDMCIRDYGGVIRTIITANKSAGDKGGDGGNERIAVKRPDNIITVERGLRREVRVLDVGC